MSGCPKCGGPLAEPIDPNRAYTTQQAVAALGTSHATLTSMFANGEIAATKIGRNWRVGGQALLDWLAVSKGTPPPEAPQRRQQNRGKREFRGI